MSKVAVTYSPVVGGSSVISLKDSFSHVGSDVIDADYREMMADIPQEEFDRLYSTVEGRQRLFAHAKAKATELLHDVNVLALSGNSAMIDPELFNKERELGQNYDFSRTIAELALVHVATEKGMPIFGVCGGHQVVAVYGGGEISDLSADRLDKQRFMNYDTVQLNKESMFAQIIGGSQLRQEVSQNTQAAQGDVQEEQEALDLQEALDISTLEAGLDNVPEAPAQELDVTGENQADDAPENSHIEAQFFGAHNQAVSRLGTGFKQTATASDNASIEAAESEFGVPIITTQFHPEVGAKGLPNASFFYKGTKAEQEMNLNVFRYLDKLGNTYSEKKILLGEINQFKPTEQVSKSGVDEAPNIKPSDILKAKSKQQEEPAELKEPVSRKQTPAKQEKTSFIGRIFSAIGAFFESIGSAIKSIFNAVKEAAREAIGRYLRDKVSDRLTGERVSNLRKKEVQSDPDAGLGAEQSQTAEAPSSSFANVLAAIKVQTPAEILRATPAQLWSKQDDEVASSTVEATLSEDASTHADATEDYAQDQRAGMGK